MEGEAVPVISGEFFDSVERRSGRIVVIVDNYDGVTAVEKLKNRVAPDVASAAGYQNVLSHP